MDIIMNKTPFYNRDLSWLSFNERLLEEAERVEVPVVEKLRFLSIFSSNLDEFYRVRIPVLYAMQAGGKTQGDHRELPLIHPKVQSLLERFGSALSAALRVLNNFGVKVYFQEDIPENLKEEVMHYFFTNVLMHLEPLSWQASNTEKGNSFFPKNNEVYLVSENSFALLPAQFTSRFVGFKGHNGFSHIVFLDDIIRLAWPFVFHGQSILGSFKITRDAAVQLSAEWEEIYSPDNQEEMLKHWEDSLLQRDAGFATRFLYDPNLSPQMVNHLIQLFGLHTAAQTPGGRYHHLKDLWLLADIVLKEKNGQIITTTPMLNGPLEYPSFSALSHPKLKKEDRFLAEIAQRDILVHTPYQKYDPVIRFFSEAAFHPDVSEIYTTLYRAAPNSKIVQSLIRAAKNGKQVTVLVELKARFDEANNIKWARALQQAGARVVHSNPSLKVHAKIALVRFNSSTSAKQLLNPSAAPSPTTLALLATGNLNEQTAQVYTDHALFTAHSAIGEELFQLFQHLEKNAPFPLQLETHSFQHLLVAQFNLLPGFLALIEEQVQRAKQGLPSGISIKLNNLEEKVLANKLLYAAEAGVPVRLLIRGISILTSSSCSSRSGVDIDREEPNGLPQLEVKRVVGRFLEHGRIFIFGADQNVKVWLGSADWMNRNIYKRIEVCFPVYEESLAKELTEMYQDQWTAPRYSEQTALAKRFSNPLWSIFLLVSLFFTSCFSKPTPQESPNHFDFSSMEKIFLSDELLEISGIYFLQNNPKTFIAVQDEKGKVFAVVPGSKNHQSFLFGKSGDYEDITLLNHFVWVLKSDGSLFQIPLSTLQDSWNLLPNDSAPQDSGILQKPDIKTWKNMLPPGEYEGLTTDGQSLWVLCKKCKGDSDHQTHAFKVELSLENNPLPATSYVLHSTGIPEKYRKQKKFKFQPSGWAYHPEQKKWYILLGFSKMLLVTDEKFNLLESISLHPSLFHQPEGICFDAEGNLYISNEGDDLTAPVVLKFLPKS